MSDLRSALAEYLRLRRGMGFKLERDAKLLAQFLDCLQPTTPPRSPSSTA